MVHKSYLGTIVPMKLLGPSRLREEEITIPYLLPTSRGKNSRQPSNASWKWVSSFTPSNGKP